jgi:flagellar biosynthetic protein FliP
MIIAGWLVLVIAAAPAGAQSKSNRAGGADDSINPITLLDSASKAIPQLMGKGAPPAESPPLGVDEPGRPQGGLSSAISIMVLLTVLTIAPAILILCTSFTRIVVVLTLLRQAIGTQNLPPSQVVVGLSVFMTLLVMAPTFDRINKEAIQPLNNQEIDQIEAWNRAKKPIRDFMFAQIDYAGNWEDVYMIMNYRGIDTSDPGRLVEGDVDMLTLIPAFIISELKVAFLMGFRLYLPFLIIDMVISSVLISMGMMMLPPVLISLPFKLLLFVLVDGWRLVVGNLLNSFAGGGTG